MARTKQAAPVRREPSSEYVSKLDREAALLAKQQEANGQTATAAGGSNGAATAKAGSSGASQKSAAGMRQAAIAVAGIYGSFLTWGYLQEKLTTTTYPAPIVANRDPANATEVFHFPVFLNTVQSAMAAVTGMLYLWATTPTGTPLPPIIPSARLLLPLLLVALTSSLASPFGYAALGHIDYITYILAKSCKLLPVMFLHVTLFRRRYPLYKYMVVAAVTAGVAVFTLHTGSHKKRASSSSSSGTGHTAWGLLLLGINLLFDGLTNSTQDYIFGAFQPFSGPQMMCANSLMQTAVTGAYLLVVSPLLVHSGVGAWLGAVDEVATSVGHGVAAAATTGLWGTNLGSGELAAALEFMQRHPSVWRDVLGFAACGAVGQIFIFYALATFSSVFLVTVTVTRKMCTMMLSVVAFGHRLSGMQWLGVGLVFGGIGVEAQIARTEKLKKEAAKAGKTQ
ncbi:solute carrier family 35 (UDP-galactose transporter), member B1 [Sporothrix brasiliensis 5110]|uniref:UDP-galactose transporter homolog 1 n=1 Tax=Sporothrix brasiliensis 5110 TaxID=1398154 RepID=A0A0C2FHZ3_9PEZI|nr:solute carrier family 35 (UDP-galactose transporter), member B1 [Sporothrix brasiliensis 5110]KIH90628.1 solute carrier family 35 (UDP-galactose transporter), member B1 [Sporothrix brasiliensis 5110]